MISQILKFLSALNSNTQPSQLALGVVFGLFLGLTPLWSLHNLIIVLLIATVKINLSFTLLSMGLFSALSYLIDPLSSALGRELLENPELTAFWTSLYQSEIWRLSHFNNTLTLGGFCLSTLTSLPIFFVSLILIKRYRDVFLAWLNKTRIMKAIKASKWFERANKVNEYREAL